MSNGRGWWLAVAALLVLTAGLTLLEPEIEAHSSSLSRDISGWYLARRMLEETGAEVTLRDLPLVDLEGPAALVLAFPWQKGIAPPEIEGIDGFLGQGGTVLFAYHGGRTAPGPREETLMTLLQLDWDAGIEERSLWPPTWFRERAEEKVLGPEPTWAGAPIISIGRQHWSPQLPAAGRVLYREDDDRSLIFDFPYRRGRVIVLPAEVFANGRLTRAENGALLASLAADFGSIPWIFDEYHHGLLHPQAVAEERRFAWDLFVVHVIVLYVLGVLALARRFGPPRDQRPLVMGSTAGFLQNLGGLHHRLGHHRQAARRLVERWATYTSRDPLPADLVAAEAVGNGRQLVALAGNLARRSRSPRRFSRGESLEP